MMLNQSPHLYDRKQIFYTNLQLLGFERFKLGSIVKQYGGGVREVRLDQEMFIMSSYNHKATELVLYFLWKNLDPLGFEQHVKIFPPRDHKEAKEFRGVCFKWLERLKAEHHLPPHVSLLASDLEESRGERFLDLMTALSSFVLSVKLKQSLGRLGEVKDTSKVLEIQHHFELFENFASHELGIIQAIIQSESELYLTRQKAHLKLQHAWLEEGAKLSAMYDVIQTQKNKIKEAYASEGFEERASRNAFKDTLGSVASRWSNLETMVKRTAPDLDIVVGVAEDRARRLLLDGESYKRALSETKAVVAWDRNGSDPIRLEPLFDAMADKVRCAGPKFNYRQGDVKDLLSTLEPRVKQHTAHLSHLKRMKERLRAEINSRKRTGGNPQAPCAKRFDCKAFLAEVAKALQSDR